MAELQQQTDLLTDPVKLVIWDLDDTFWDGALSEGGIRYRQDHHAVVMELARRGIVSSVCSKNSAEAVGAVLAEHGIADYFVFSRISWQPKGEMIRQLVADMQLRSPNVLFLDDHPMNLQEAAYYNPGIQVATPADLPALLDLPQMQGNADPRLERLQQYRLLERRTRDRRQTAASNEEFLRQSGIQVALLTDCLPAIERIADLVQRANQLNFTKLRSSTEELTNLLTQSDVNAGGIMVQDRYGNYGVVGFYALRGGRLVHFVFSCRVMNMGVEQWLYQHLRRPALEIVPEVSSDPTTAEPVDWIEIVEPQEVEPPSEQAEPSDGAALASASETAISHAPARPRILFKGGCDLEAVIDMLGRSSGIVIEGVRSRHGVPIHPHHTVTIRLAVTGAAKKYADVIAKLPFIDLQDYSTDLFNLSYDGFILSLLTDYTQGLYRLRGTELIVSYGDHLNDLTRPESDAWALKRPFLTREFLDWFRAEFEFLGPISDEQFRENVRWLCDRVPSGSMLLLMNGAEVDLPSPHEPNRHERHRRLNAIVDEELQGRARVALCDLRLVVRSRDDVEGDIRHYQRRVYVALGEQMHSLLASHSMLPTASQRDVVQRWLQSLRRQAWHVRQYVKSALFAR